MRAGPGHGLHVKPILRPAENCADHSLCVLYANVAGTVQQLGVGLPGLQALGQPRCAGKPQPLGLSGKERLWRWGVHPRFPLRASAHTRVLQHFKGVYKGALPRGRGDTPPHPTRWRVLVLPVNFLIRSGLMTGLPTFANVCQSFNGGGGDVPTLGRDQAVRLGLRTRQRGQ